MIRTVFFDVGTTLIHAAPSMGEIYRRELAPLGVSASADEFSAAFGAVWDQISDEVGSGNNRFAALPGGERAYWREYVQRVLDRLGAPADVDRATSALHAAFSRADTWAMYPDVLETLAWLRGRGVAMGVISNWDSRLPALLESLGLARFFDPIVSSSAFGEEKPSPGIFEEALARASVTAGEAAHVGDDLLNDYRGAEAAGLTAVLVDRRGTAPEGLRRVSTLRELTSLLDYGGRGAGNGSGAGS